MESAGTHIVQKSHLKIRLTDKERAFDIQSQVTDLFQSKVLPMLEREFDHLVPADQVIQLDRLQLDLGNIRLEYLREEFPRMVVEKLREAFAKVMAAPAGQPQKTKVTQTTAASSNLEALLRFLETGLWGWEVDQQTANPAEWITVMLEEQPALLIRALAPRLQQAHVANRLSLQLPHPVLNRLIQKLLPENQLSSATIVVILQSTETLAAEINVLPQSRVRREAMVYAWILQNTAFLATWKGVPTHLFWKMIADCFSQADIAPTTIEGKIKDLDLSALLQLLPLLGQDYKTWVEKTRAAFEPESIFSPRLRNILRNILGAVLIEGLRSEGSGILITQLKHQFERWSQQLQPKERKELAALMFLTDDVFQKEEAQQASEENHAKKPAAEKPLRQKHPKNPKGKLYEENAPIDNDGPQNEWTDTEEEKSLRLLNTPTETQLSNKKAPASAPYNMGTDETEVIYIDNAGLVLLNPFFAPCFEEFGWMENGQFTTEEFRENAVLLTAYMASGENEIVEARLPLAKLLCGMDLHQPVRAAVDLPSYILEEADSLLMAANGHWEKAGKLTPAQFREAFLMREGRLKPMGAGWNLKVDRHTIDILLEFLPWTFGMIKLPWMESLISVDW